MDKTKTGTRVVTTSLVATQGMAVAEKHIYCRRAGVTGVIDGVVPGHGGDVVWIRHDDTGDVGAYVINEFEVVPLPEPTEIVYLYEAWVVTKPVSLGKLFRELELARQCMENELDSHIAPRKRPAIKMGDGRYLLLSSENPVTAEDSDGYIKAVAKSARQKLTDVELKALGLPPHEVQT